MRPVILYRNIDKEFDVGGIGNELEFASKYFYCTNSRMDLKKDDLVVMRYCELPFFEEQARDLAAIGAKPINSFKQHRYVADLASYVADLEELTPQTWLRLEDIPYNELGPFFLKGETNSKKFQFLTHCYAANREEAIQVYLRLLDDGLISTQAIYIRKFEKLKTYFTVSSAQLPITKEFRVFVAYGEILTKAFYWSSNSQDLKDKGLYPSTDEIPDEFINECIARIGNACPFYCIDVAQKEDGSWICIELNSGPMCGLSDTDPDEFYKNLAAQILKNNI